MRGARRWSSAVEPGVVMARPSSLNPFKQDRKFARPSAVLDGRGISVGPDLISAPLSHAWILIATNLCIPQHPFLLASRAGLLKARQSLRAGRTGARWRRPQWSSQLCRTRSGRRGLRSPRSDPLPWNPPWHRRARVADRRSYRRSSAVNHYEPRRPLPLETCGDGLCPGSLQHHGSLANVRTKAPRC